MDENVPGAITEALKKRGLDVLTVQEDGLTSAPDPVVFKRAIELGRVFF
jgi:predicted nuclease of predicted toxin-antitoxin system